MALRCRLDGCFGVEDRITVIVAPLSVFPTGTAGGFLLFGGAGGGRLCGCDCGRSDVDEEVEVEVGDGVDISEGGVRICRGGGGGGRLRVRGRSCDCSGTPGARS